MDPKDVDWTDALPESPEVSPLTAETCVERLRLLSVRAADIRKLRAKMATAQ